MGSVRFDYDTKTNYRTETQPPYAFAADNGTLNGQPNYNAWAPTVGSHAQRPRPSPRAAAAAPPAPRSPLTSP
ncbi:MAG: hypothetical protein WKG07_37245 [Hymenobacter sp.]